MDRPPLTGTLRFPNRRETTRVIGGSALIAAICWYFGVNVWHAILLGCAVTVVVLAGVAGTSAPEAHDLSWRVGVRKGREGSRNEVASLSSSLRVGWRLVGLTAERSLYKIARRRLALEDLDLQNADHRMAIELRIGTPAYRILVDRKRRLRLRTLMHCLDALDAVNPTYYPAPQPRSRGRQLRLIPSNPGRTRER